MERNVGGKTFVLTPNSHLHVLDNPSASHLWIAIRDAGEVGVDLGSLVESLVKGFQVDHGQARKDVSGFLDHLVNEEVIEEMTG